MKAEYISKRASSEKAECASLLLVPSVPLSLSLSRALIAGGKEACVDRRNERSVERERKLEITNLCARIYSSAYMSCGYRKGSACRYYTHRRGHGKTCAETRNHGRHTCHRLFTLTIPSELCLPATRRYITDRSIAVLRNTAFHPSFLPSPFPFFSFFFSFNTRNAGLRPNPLARTTPDTTIFPPYYFSLFYRELTTV